MQKRMICSNCGNKEFNVFTDKVDKEVVILRCSNKSCQAGTVLRGYVDDDNMRNRMAYFPADKILEEGVITFEEKNDKN